MKLESKEPKLDMKRFKEYDIGKVVSLCLAIVSVMISFFLIPYHEIWRDEGQAWLIARDTPLADLFGVLKHEGHPALWFLILMPFAKAGLPCICMNYISWFFSALSVFIIAIKAPFHTMVKALLILSPMYVYWLPVVSRGYAPLSFLFIVLALIYNTRQNHPILYGTVLFCMINIHLIGAGLVGSVLMIDIFEYYREWRVEKSISLRKCSGTIIGVVGCLLMVLQMVGSPNTGNWNISIIYDTELIKHRLHCVMQMLFPPANNYGIFAFIIIAVFITISILYYSMKYWAALFILFLETSCILYILFFIMPSGQKVYFMLVTLIFCMWITTEPSFSGGEQYIWKLKVMHLCVGGVFLLTIITGYKEAIVYDIREPYSMGKNVADYLNNECKESDTIIFMDNAYEPSVTAYLSRNLKVWDITEGKTGTFPIWSKERSQNNVILFFLYQSGIVNEGDEYTGDYMTTFMQQYVDQCFPEGEKVFWVLDWELADLYDNEADLENYVLLHRFYGSCKFSSESFSVYQFISRGQQQ